MPIRTLSDLNSAYDEGRWHQQRILKNTSVSHSSQWIDVTFASGQPAYDPRIGVSGKFTPCVATGNDAVWFPSIPESQHRHLVGITARLSQSTYIGPASLVVFDLIGYYPLIDGDSTDEQLFDNSIELPRYKDGETVALVVINHVAPAINAGVAIIKYIDSKDQEKTATVSIANNGVGTVCSGTSSSASSDVGPVTVSLANGTSGIKKILSVQYSVPPGGLHCFYLVRVLTTLVTGDNAVACEKDMYVANATMLPRIFDGAWIGMFERLPPGTARTTTLFGHLTFAWG